MSEAHSHNGGHHDTDLIQGSHKCERSAYATELSRHPVSDGIK